MTSNYPASLDSFSTVTDGVTTVLAAESNNQSDAIEAIQAELGTDPAGGVASVKLRLNQGMSEAFSAETASLSATRTLADTNANIQYLNCNGADRDVTLPAEASSNHQFTIVNTTAANYVLTVKNDGGDVVGYVYQAQTAKFESNGVAWEMSSTSNPTRYAQITCFNYTVDNATGDGAGYFVVPPELDGMDLVFVQADVITAGTTNTEDIEIYNVTDTVDMLSTTLTIDSAETSSSTAATPVVIDTSNDDVAAGDLLRVDVDAVHTTEAKGLIVTLGFRLP